MFSFLFLDSGFSYWGPTLFLTIFLIVHSVVFTFSMHASDDDEDLGMSVGIGGFYTVMASLMFWATAHINWQGMFNTDFPATVYFPLPYALMACWAYLSNDQCYMLNGYAMKLLAWALNLHALWGLIHIFETT